MSVLLREYQISFRLLPARFQFPDEFNHSSVHKILSIVTDTFQSTYASYIAIVKFGSKKTNCSQNASLII